MNSEVMNLIVNLFLFVANSYFAMADDSTWPKFSAFAAGICLMGTLISAEKLLTTGA